MSQSIFAPLTPNERLAQRQAYLEWSQKRNGDILGRKLSEREKFFEDLDSTEVYYEGDISAEEYWEAYRITSPQELRQKKFSRFVLFLVLVSYLNIAEKFTIDRALEKERFQYGTPTDPMEFIKREEDYHSRILMYIMQVFKISLNIQDPKGIFKWSLLAIAKLPLWLVGMFVFLGEIVAVVLFVKLRELATELIGTSSPAAVRVRALIDEIMIDEVGHMAFVRTTLGPRRIKFAERIFTIVVKRMFGMIPATIVLYDVEELARIARGMTFDFVPQDIRPYAFMPVSDSLSDTVPDSLSPVL
jgi:hypothetical protein